MTHQYPNSLSGQERSYRYDIDVILENYMPSPSTPTTTAMLKKQTRAPPRPTGASTSKSRPHTPPPAEFYMKSGASPPSGSRRTTHGHTRGGSTSHVPSLSAVSAILSPRPMSAIDRSKMQDIATANRSEQLGKRDGVRDDDARGSTKTVSSQRGSERRASVAPPVGKTKSSGTQSSRQPRVSAQGETRRQHSSSKTTGRQSKSEPASSAEEDDETIHARLPIVEDL